jgi:hypothetical protein
MKYSKVLRRYAKWGLALCVLVACGTQPNNTPPSTYGYPVSDNAGSTAAANSATGSANSAGAGGDMTVPTPGSSGGNALGDGNPSGGTGAEGGSCPSSCKTSGDCASCGLPAGSSVKNCCVMAICVAMTVCPTIRDSGTHGS